ncbi:hypothetical protein [Novosphingobium sp.]|uniref:hypothetical protein n=1 Tax=Novosphingobium sp. TaxID=1874826 RepID=UPI00286DD18A|nr:hypothetical protein [Novosphingobium sp.]
MRITRLAALACAASIASPALAQNHEYDHSAHEEAPAPAPVPAPAPAPAPAATGNAPQTEPYVHHAHDASSVRPKPSFGEGSGTARLPGNEGGMHGLHLGTGDWMVMLHGDVSAKYTKATGPRGDDKFYSTSMLMAVAQTEPEWGRVQLKSMLSLEPAMDANGYPNLFATGETAGGLPLVDRQHPHDLFMELAARVDFNIGDQTRLFLYGGPVGEPALGPSAFMHRGSAAYNPEPPIAHHWFDSTHITYGVVTAGLAGNMWQIEASAFRGREPDEDRWNIETPKLDSWSVRGTLNPTPNWAIQASYGEIKEPEAVHPGENEHRFTASAHYASEAVSAMLAYSAKKRVPGETLVAWLGEVNWKLDSNNVLFGRFENVANDELFPDHSHPLHDEKFRVSKFQAGYARRIPLGDTFQLALGGSVAAYAKPDVLDPYYGKSPMGYTLFAKLSLGH